MKLLSFVSLAIALVGCGGGDTGGERPPNETTRIVRVVVSSESRAVMERLAQAYLATNPKYLDGSKIGIELVVLDNLAAADRIASGALKVPMWLAPDRSLAEVVAAKAVNLGAKPAECVPLFETTLGVIGKRGDIRTMQAGADQIDLVDLMKPKPNGEASDPLSTPTFLFPNPAISWSGRLFLTTFARLRKESDRSSAQLRRVLLDPVESETSIAQRVVAFQGSNPMVGFVTEQSARLMADPALSFSKLSQGGVVSRYSLCTSVAPWVQESDRLAADRFKSFLRDSRAREIVSQFGFDTPSADAKEPPVEIDELVSLQGLVESERRFPALMVVLDLSGSLTGDPCLSLKEVLTDFIESFTKENPAGRIAIVVFNTTIERATAFSSSGADAIQAVNSTDCRGGSAVYPAIIRAIEEFGESGSALSAQSSRHLAIISDGYSSALPGEEESFVSRSSRLLMKHGVSAHFFGVSHTTGDLKDLPSRLQSIGAGAMVIPLDQLGSKLEAYRRSFVWSLDSPK